MIEPCIMAPLEPGITHERYTQNDNIDIAKIFFKKNRLLIITTAVESRVVSSPFSRYETNSPVIKSIHP